MNPTDVTPGDRIDITYTTEDGETREWTDGLVKPSWTDDITPVEFGSGRTGTKLVLREDGSVRAKPLFNANGRGENGTVDTITEAES